MSAKSWVGAVAGVVLVSTVVIANWATTRFGFVPVGFGQMATAGTFAAGFALAARDAIQDGVGRGWMLLCLAAAAALSYLVADPRIAAASAVAFAASELLDFAVYTPIRARAQLGDKRWAGAVVASGCAGAIADTAIFIGIAFGPAAVLPAMAGQLVGKAWATFAYLVIGKATASAVLRESNQQPKGA